MPKILQNAPKTPADAGPEPAAIDIVEWLGGLLDMACDREDAPLARLIAGVMDDVAGAGRR